MWLNPEVLYVFFKFQSYPTVADFEPIIQRIDFAESRATTSSNLPAALAVWNELRRVQSPPEALKMILIITHSQTDNSFLNELTRQRNNIQSLQPRDRPKIVIVGIGQSGTRDWQSLASPPPQENLLYVTSVSGLNSVTSQVLRATSCNSFRVDPRPTGKY